MEIMRLRHISTVMNSNVDKVIDPAEVPVRLCNYVHVYKNDFITTGIEFDSGSATEAEIKRFRLRIGDVIITKDSEDRHDIGVPAFVRNTADDIVCGYHLTILRALPQKCRGDFLFWALQSKAVQEAFAVAASGITRYGLGQEGIKGLSLHLPDLATQKQIADFLNTETARIDALIEKKQRLIETLELKRSSAISHAVTKGILRDAPMRASGINWLGDIPKSWMLTKLGYLGRCANGINIGGEAFGSGYPFISYGDVYKNRELPRSGSGLVQSTEADRKTFSVEAGDVFFTRTSETIEEVGFSSVCLEKIEDAVFAGFLIRFRAYEDCLHPRFSKFGFQHSGLRDYFASEMNLITRASLSQDLLRNMPVPLPPMREQQTIANHLENLDARISEISDRTKSGIILLAEKRAALITAAVTGQIDVIAYARHEGARELQGDANPVVVLFGAQRQPNHPDRRTLRVLVAAEVIYRHNASATFGRIKLQKLMFLAEAHANINEIAGCYERYRAGPYDADMVHEIESGLRQERFYDAQADAATDRKKVEFQRMERAGEHRDKLSLALGVKAAALGSLVDLFKDMNTEATEAVATLYAVWNDALIDGQQPDDTFIIKGFLQDWHADKKKFNEADLQIWLGWMRRNDVVPHGDGPRTISTRTRNLFESE